jgi:hypothetical protein
LLLLEQCCFNLWGGLTLLLFDTLLKVSDLFLVDRERCRKRRQPGSLWSVGLLMTGQSHDDDHQQGDAEDGRGLQVLGHETWRFWSLVLDARNGILRRTIHG